MELIHHHQRITKLLGHGLYKDRNHPIYNFLFEYFHFKPKILFQYSEGIELPVIEIEQAGNMLNTSNKNLSWNRQEFSSTDLSVKVISFKGEARSERFGKCSMLASISYSNDIINNT